MDNKGKKLEDYLFGLDDRFVNRLKEKHRHIVGSENFQWTMKVNLLIKQREKKHQPVVNPTSPISAVMIVKNESKTIRWALSSIANYVSEIIVVDTGSTDGTFPMLRNIMMRECKALRLYKKKIKPWSFAKAKNWAISKASQPFIWIIDGDEEISNFPVDFAPEPLNVYHVRIVNSENKSSARVPRIFPRNRSYRYESEVHNRLICGPGATHNAPHSLEALHWSTIDTKKEESRLIRTEKFVEEIGKNKVKGFPDYFNICKMCVTLGRWKDLDVAFNASYAIWTALPERTKIAFSGYLLFPSFAAVSRNKYDNWHIGEHIALVGERVDNMFCSFAKCYYEGDLPQALYFANQYLKLSETEIHIPFSSQASLKWQPDVVLKAGLIEYYLKNLVE